MLVPVSMAGVPIDASVIFHGVGQNRVIWLASRAIFDLRQAMKPGETIPLSPAGDAVYLDCEVGHTRPCSHELDQSFFADV